MRFLSEPNPRLLAGTLALSVVVSGGTFLLIGCGGGTSTAIIGIASYSGRSYTVRNLSLAGERTAALTLQVSANNVLSGVLNLTNPADSVALTGTLNRATGAFQLNGALTRASGDPVSVSGTLPTPPASTGGSLTLTIGGQTYSASFTTSTSPSPTPTPSGGTGSPTPTPTPPGGTPTPTPTPTGGTPGTGNGTLADYYAGFVSNSNDTFTYKLTSTDTLAPDPNGQSGTTSDEITFHGSMLFGAGLTGQKTTVTIILPISGNKTVTRQESLNPANGVVIGYTYFTEDSSGRTDYGDDTVINGIVVSSTRYDNGRRTPYNLSPGQSSSQTYTVFEKEFDVTGTITKQYNYLDTVKFTFVGIEGVTVIGGTYSNTAHVRYEESYTLPAIATGANDQPTTSDRAIYLSKFVGLVLSTDRTVTQNLADTVNTTGAAYTYTKTSDGRDELVSATVNGTNYPPGRSVTHFGGTIPKHSYLSPHRH